MTDKLPPTRRPPAPLPSAGGKPALRPVPPPDIEPPTPELSGLECRKCGARFRWERAEPDKPKSPLALRVQVGSSKCDCGFGRPRGEV